MKEVAFPGFHGMLFRATMTANRAVITGMGVIAPNGIGLEPFWEANVEGRSGITRITRFDASDLESRIAGEITGFNPLQFMPAGTVRRTDTFVHLGVAAARMALENSGLELSREDPARIGVVVGSGLGGIIFHEEQMIAAYDKGTHRINPLAVPRASPNAVSGHIAIQFGLWGPNFAISAACASGALAIGEALRKIRFGEIDVCLCGGVEAPLTRFSYASYSALGALSRKRNDAPREASRPFDRDRDGFVIAEGSAMLVVEEMDRALARDAHIYAEIAGYAAGCGAYHMVMPQPDGRDAARVMEGAIRDAGVPLGTIGYVNAHGTSTALNDAIETTAIKEVFRDRAYDIPISSTKSMIGHTIGAAGAIEALVSAMVLDRGIIPPTINYQCQDPDCDLDYVPNEARSVPVNAALSNSFGFGGCNACLVLRKLGGS